MSYQQQQQLMMERDREVYKALSAVPYPKDKVHPQLEDWLKAALQYHNDTTLQCSWEDYKAIVEKDPRRFNVQQMQYALNAIVYCKPFEIVAELKDYMLIRKHVQNMVNDWYAIMNPIRQEAITAFNTRQSLSVPPSKILS